jgi:lysophospholipase L1-like esterase
MRIRRVLLPAVASAIALAAASTAAAEPARVGYPSSIASTGDSITRAFNTCSFPYIDCPANSWATGSSGTVNGHYRRILAANPAISGRTFNDAQSGADMADFTGQAQRAVTQGAQYVTVMLGANDACASSEAAMTPTATFRAQFAQGLQTLSSGLPTASIFVASVPDLRRLWAVWRDSFAAQSVWALAGICPSMLANAWSNSTADTARRERVRQRVIEYNAQLRDVCALFVHCRYDNGVVFETAFVRSDVTTRDYFHPSVAGQTKLAAVTWAATFDFTDASAPVSTASTSPAVGGTAVTLSATDDRGVSGIEYRLGAGAWVRYVGTVLVPTGQTVTWRAVDVNGNSEATTSLVG